MLVNDLRDPGQDGRGGSVLTMKHYVAGDFVGRAEAPGRQPYLPNTLASASFASRGGIPPSGDTSHPHRIFGETDATISAVAAPPPVTPDRAILMEIGFLTRRRRLSRVVVRVQGN